MAKTDNRWNSFRFLVSLQFSSLLSSVSTLLSINPNRRFLKLLLGIGPIGSNRIMALAATHDDTNDYKSLDCICKARNVFPVQADESFFQRKFVALHCAGKVLSGRNRLETANDSSFADNTTKDSLSPAPTFQGLSYRFRRQFRTLRQIGN